MLIIEFNILREREREREKSPSDRNYYCLFVRSRKEEKTNELWHEFGRFIFSLAPYRGLIIEFNKQQTQ